ncbi:MAG TPA: GNAT family N-acetyltransferase [Pirellulales bacterium]|jgi:UDP-4-amino-4,6-dideoxy-N-acetyl-beta-L-altrosamine N-acetyltransferase|nr:GNAT family N-acetyltransferase [Pirellulales bacterium]
MVARQSQPGRLASPLQLVPLAPAHLERTLAWANNPQLMRLLNRSKTISSAEHEQWFAALEHAADRQYWAIEMDDGRHIGNIWLWQIDPHHRKAEVRIVIGEAASQGRGLGSRAIQLVTDLAFATLDLHRLYAFVLAINPRARRAFEKAGFCAEGILKEDRWTGDRHCDVFALGRLRQPAPTS